MGQSQSRLIMQGLKTELALQGTDKMHLIVSLSKIGIKRRNIRVAYRLEYKVDDTNWAKVEGLMSRSSFKR